LSSAFARFGWSGGWADLPWPGHALRSRHCQTRRARPSASSDRHTSSLIPADRHTSNLSPVYSDVRVGDAKNARFDERSTVRASTTKGNHAWLAGSRPSRRRSEMTAGGPVRLPTCSKAPDGTVSRATRRVVSRGPSAARPLTPASQVLHLRLVVPGHCLSASLDLLDEPLTGRHAGATASASYISYVPRDDGHRGCGVQAARTAWSWSTSGARSAPLGQVIVPSSGSTRTLAKNS
jgi:hypothetical protein